jgi:hypothetical protein
MTPFHYSVEDTVAHFRQAFFHINFSYYVTGFSSMRVLTQYNVQISFLIPQTMIPWSLPPLWLAECQANGLIYLKSLLWASAVITIFPLTIHLADPRSWP